MAVAGYPVHVDAALDPTLSRWLWLVKWLLAIPHYVVLALLWTAFALMSVAAFFTILFTGRYPRTIFEFNVGVLRWTWRVAYYAYGALGTDRYPPFSLYEDESYPAHLEVEYPEHLSRGLVLVKWWLLALPHYLVVAIFAGGGVYAASHTRYDGLQWVWNSGGLIGLMVLVAAVVLLVTGRYPQQIFDFVLGMNRWVIRVAAYAALMTDDYPPFRLDMGGSDPSPGHVALPARPGTGGAGGVAVSEAGPAVAPPVAAPPPQTTPPPQTALPPTTAPGAPAGGVAGQRSWTTGPIVALVFAGLVFLAAGGLLAGGTALLVADHTMRDGQGYFMSPEQRLATSSYALTSPAVTLGSDLPSEAVPQGLLGDGRVTVSPGNGEPLFVGVARSADAERFLANVAHETLVGFQTRDGVTVPRYVQGGVAGGAPAILPGDSGIWVASSSGTGPQSVTWPLASGRWTVVVMNANGNRGVSADVAAGATFPGVGWIVAGLLLSGAVLLAVSVALLLLALRAAARAPAPPLPRQASEEGTRS